MPNSEAHAIDFELGQWQQGDVILGARIPAVHIADLTMPLTPESEELAVARELDRQSASIALVPKYVPGFMLVSQTCDIVRSASDRPYVELCPLTELAANHVAAAKAGRSPRFVFAGTYANRDYFADLDQVSTIEKSLLARYRDNRHPFVTNDAERRIIASALGRKRSRSALPDDFNIFIEPMRKRIVEKHGKNSEEGRFLEATQEIRVQVTPAWNRPKVAITLWFLFEQDALIPPNAEDLLEALLARVGQSTTYEIEAFARSLTALSAAAYLGSDRLDLDSLSYG
jgi:hypothetical protein